MKLVIKDGAISVEAAPVPHEIEIEVAAERLHDENAAQNVARAKRANALDLHPGLHSALISLVFHTNEPRDGLALAVEAALLFASAEGIAFSDIAEGIRRAEPKLKERNQAWSREILHQIVEQVVALKKIAQKEADEARRRRDGQ